MTDTSEPISANSPATHPNTLPHLHPTMARKAIAKDQIVKLIVGAGQASPSPPVGPALGSKGVKSMDFCKVRLPIAPAVAYPYSRLSHTQFMYTDDNLGVQRPHSPLHPRDPHPRPHNRPPRPLLPLPTAHTPDRNAPPLRRRRAPHQEQDKRSWKRARAYEQPRWSKGQDEHQ